MEPNMEGGCTCRRVRYLLVGRPLIVHACHCRWCQRETGTAHALNALYEADRVVHTAGEPELVWTPSASGKGQKGPRAVTGRRTEFALSAGAKASIFANRPGWVMVVSCRTNMSTSTEAPTCRM